MDEKNSTFQMVILGVFIVLAVIGVAVFAIFQAQKANSVTLSLWGDYSASIVDPVLKELEDSGTIAENKIIYRYIDPAEFDGVLLEALALGSSPDMILLREDKIMEYENKILVVPYKSLSERRFKDLFAEEGELYLTPNGIVALPLVIDPLVMYWNRTLLANEGIAKPPTYWDEIPDFVEDITKLSQERNVLTAALSFGEYRNVTNAKGILSALFLQAGVSITMRSESDVVSSLQQQASSTVAPAPAVLNFYTEFSNPIKTVYTWNRALPQSQRMFLSNDLALYFGYASELKTLREQNPNLNFDVSIFPQIRGSIKKLTYGKMIGIALMRTTPRVQEAFNAAFALATGPAGESFASRSNTAPTRRDLLGSAQEEAFQSVTYSSALIAEGWLDPHPITTDTLFQRMIEDVVSGRGTASQVVRDGDRELERLINN